MAIKRIALKHHPNIYEYTTKRGKRYSVRRRYKNNLGKYETYTSAGWPSWREAEQDLRKFEMGLFDGSLTESEVKKITLNDYFIGMKKRKLDSHVWQPSTADLNETEYNKHFRQPFGHMAIQDITRPKYLDFMNQLGASGEYTYYSLRHINTVMQTIINDAVINNVLVKNKLKKIPLHTDKAKRSQTVDRTEYETFIAAAKNVLPEYDWLLVQLMTLGERRGELMGLKSNSSFEFASIDGEEACAITFQQAITRNNPNGGGLKNETAYRTIWVSGAYVNVIKEAIAFSNQIMINTGQDPDEDHFIWLQSTGRPYAASRANDILRRVEKSCGIHMYPHKFRHYFATKANSDKLSGTDVMHWLGHANQAMTDSYTRSTPEGALNVFKGIENDLGVTMGVTRNSQGVTKGVTNIGEAQVINESTKKDEH